MLALNGTPVTDACLKDISELKELNTLFLGDTPISDVGLKEIKRLT